MLMQLLDWHHTKSQGINTTDHILNPYDFTFSLWFFQLTV